MTPAVSNCTPVLLTVIQVEAALALLVLIVFLVAAGVYLWRTRI